MSARQPEPERLEEIRAELTEEFAAWLVKKAREHRARGPQYAKQADVIGVLASKVARGAVRPDNLATLPAQDGPEDVPALLAEVKRLTAVIAERDRGVQIINDDAVRRAAYEAMDGERRAGESRAAVLHKRIADLDAEVTRLHAEVAASRAAVLDEAADAFEAMDPMDFALGTVDPIAELRRMAAEARAAQTGGAS